MKKAQLDMLYEVQIAQVLSDRGLSPKDVTLRRAVPLQALERAGLVKGPNRSWGWRLTAKAREVLRQDREVKARREDRRHAKLRGAGLDPKMPVSQMTREQVLQFLALKGD